MADSAASSTSRAPRPATARRRARAAAAESGPQSPGAALVLEASEPAAPATARDEGRDSADGGEGRQDPRDERPHANRLDDDLLGAMQTMNLDPRQGTFAGFELPADALDSLRARVAAEGTAAESEAAPAPSVTVPIPSVPAEQTAMPEQPIPEQPILEQPPGVRIADIAAYLRVDDAASATARNSDAADKPAPAKAQPSTRPSTDDRATGAANAANLAQAASMAALTETVAALSRTLAEERRVAAESRRRMARLFAVVTGVCVLVLALGIIQLVVLARVARESAAAQEKTEALLRSQQSALAAFLDTASGAAADIRGTADALAARLAALPSRQGAAQPSSSSPSSQQASSSKHARSARMHRPADRAHLGNLP